MMESIFEQALNINSPWFISKMSFDESNSRLDIHLDFVRGSKFADEDGELCQVHDTITKTWRHLNFFQHECYLHARVPRIKRKNGKVKLTTPPWTGALSGFTLLFEALLIQLCKAMPVNQVSKLTKVSNYLIWKVLDTYIERARAEQNLEFIEVVGIDETSLKKGHNYITLFVDLDSKRTVYVADGKANDTVVDFVSHLEEQGGRREQVKQVSCDMSPAFIKGVDENLPKAEITFDKFHLLKLINKGVDKVRREEAKDNPLLKGTRYVFLKNDSNLTLKQRAQKEALALPKLNLKSFRAMRIRESFQQLYLLKTVDEFEAGLKKWYSWAVRSRLEPMRDVAKTIKNHWDGVLHWMESKINNGILEGLNSVLQATKRKARGYKGEHFKTIAYLLTGKLDFSSQNEFLPTQI